MARTRVNDTRPGASVVVRTIHDSSSLEDELQRIVKVEVDLMVTGVVVCGCEVSIRHDGNVSLSN